MKGEIQLEMDIVYNPVRLDKSQCMYSALQCGVLRFVLQSERLIQERQSTSVKKINLNIK